MKPLLLALFALIATSASAQITVTDAWVRGTVPGQKATGAFMKLQSVVDATLVGAESSAAAAVEIHEMSVDGGVMRMRSVERIALPAGKTVELGPGGYHVMLMDLKQPLKEGQKVPVTLTFTDAAGKRSTLAVVAPVRALTAPPMKH
jgi:copper(I)-binding protein